MEFPFSQDEWGEILTNLYKRAAADHQFHTLCLRDSHAAIKLVCGKEIPKYVKIRFEEQHPDEIVLLLPRENKVLFRELSDSELDQVAKGMASVCLPFTHTLEIPQQPRGYT